VVPSGTGSGGIALAGPPSSPAGGAESAGGAGSTPGPVPGGRADPATPVELSAAGVVRAFPPPGGGDPVGVARG
jgi:hypothetical protein